MADPDVDIAICGAGPVGAAAALFLRERGVAASRIALIDARTRDAAAADDRMIAISHGSATLLARLGAWRDGIETRATAIETIHVSHRGRFGRTVIDRRDYDVPALGYVVRHGDLTDALDGALTRAGLEIRRPARVTGIEPLASGLVVALGGTTGDDVAAGAATDAASSISTRHAVHAEGGLFGGQAPRAIRRDYGQTAITAFVVPAESPGAALARTAFERFTDHGPIALLPAIERQSDGRRVSGYSLVWCGRPDDVADRMALSDAAFLVALRAAFGDRLGGFAGVGPRRSYPLGLNAVRETARVRSATAVEFAIGNAAQALHPVAGQGLNLGLRDAHDLSVVLAGALLHPDRAPDAAALARRYVASRRLDRTATIGLTDWMPRVFASPLAPVAAARGWTLALLDLAKPLRGAFARQMMNGRR